MSDRKQRVAPSTPAPKCEYERNDIQCGDEAVVAMIVSSSTQSTWLCHVHVRSWLHDHNLGLDDVL